MSRRDVEIRRKERHVRKAQSRRRNNITFFAIFGGLVASAVGLWLLSQSSLFDIKTIEVDGVTHLTHEESVRMSGVRLGENLLRLSLKDIEARMVRSPWVRSAEVAKDPPSRLRLIVDERKPIALVKARDGRAILDSTGYVIDTFPKSGKTPYAKLPLIEAPDSELPQVGARTIDNEMKDAVEVLAALDPAIGKRVKTMVLGGPEELRFYMKNEIEIFFGSSDEKVKKSRVLARILHEYGKTGGLPVYVDVRTPDSPVARDLPDYPKDQ